MTRSDMYKCDGCNKPGVGHGALLPGGWSRVKHYYVDEHTALWNCESANYFDLCRECTSQFKQLPFWDQNSGKE